MRFMMLVIPKAYEHAKADFVPPADLVAKMTKFNESLTQAGVLLSLDGLQPPAKAARIKFGSGRTQVLDGPFAEAKEMVGGFFLVDCATREEAIAIAQRCPAAQWCTVEVRAAGPCYE